MYLVSKEDKKVFASIQHSRATLLRLMDVKDKKRKNWADIFIDELTRKPAVIKKNISAFEKAVAKASDTLSLGENVKFTTAIKLLRREIFASGTDAFNELYYLKLLDVVLGIFQEVLAVALHDFEQGQLLQERLNTLYLAKSAQILEEARLTEFAEDEYE